MKMAFLLTVFGVLLIVEGIPWFLSPLGMKRFLRQLASLPDSLLRLLGFLAMMVGLFLVWIGRG